MRRQGFTLIELAITLTIIGILVGGSFQALKSMRERNKVTEAKDRVISAKNSVIGYALEYVDLPTVTEFDANVFPKKGVQAPMFYFADPKLNSDDDICAFNSTDLNVTLYTSGTLDKTVTNVAFVVAAPSVNHNLQTDVSGAGPYEVRVDDPAFISDRNSADYTRAEEFDDVVQWVTLAELQQIIGCGDKPLKFLNARLPNAEVNSSYSATLYIENNISSITITCTNNGDKNITFDGISSFNGIPNTAGTSFRSCTAAEAAPSSRSFTKNFVITIDP